jgi:restriction system protein
VARSRGVLATIVHEMERSAKSREQEARAAQRAHAAAARRSEQLRKQEERAQAHLARATAAEQKAAEREAIRLHVEAMQADVIDSLLSSTLRVDDYVDLERLRTVAQHPPFPRADLEQPLPQPPPLQAPMEPQFVEPLAPGGVRGLFGRKQHAEALAQAQAEFQHRHQEWRLRVAELPTAQMRQIQDYQAAEQRRLALLEQARQQYAAECQQRELQVQQGNAALDALIQGLAAGEKEAVQEYVSIVLSNSVYPDCFPVEHDFEFDASLRELTLQVIVPAPQDLPRVKEWKYNKSKDEIASADVPLKAQKDRYATAVAQVALRTLHEVFEADRMGWVQTISLTVGSESVDAATGLVKYTPLVAVATDRSFASFDLSNVVPAATLQHLGAQVSKNPFDLASIDTSKGVRGK